MSFDARTAPRIARPPLAGRVAIVTADWAPVATAVAARFCHEGADVIVLGACEAAVDRIAVATGAVAFVGDPGSVDDVSLAVAYARERFGGLDAVVATGAALDEADTATLATVCSTACEELAERRGAVVIVSAPGCPSEHEVAELARACAPWGVRVNAVASGWADEIAGEVAAVVRFLATAEAAIVTGCVLQADRGARTAGVPTLAR
jgi:NAD(P)-dependent dehydrogenase (short-subunit alcohol dehydrogenase family)